MEKTAKKVTKTPESKSIKPHPVFKSFERFGISFSNHLLCSSFMEYQADRKGKVTPALIRHYVSMIQQGVGAVIVESTYVSQQGRNNLHQLGISEEEHLEGLAQLVKAVKKEGGAIGISLTHAGAKTSEFICGEQPVSPSPCNFGRDFDTSREFDIGDREEIILHFVHAAERAQEVGMDFIEIHGTDQHLLDQCFSLKFNNREDEFGPSSLEDRMRLPMEIVHAIKQRDSISLPISYQFSIHEKLEDGFNADELQQLIKMLEKNGIDFFHPMPPHILNRVFDEDENLLEWISKFTKKPIIAEGNIKSPMVLKDISMLRLADWYVMERSIYARPQWFQFLKRKLVS